jgi:hypothetical protein
MSAGAGDDTTNSVPPSLESGMGSSIPPAPFSDVAILPICLPITSFIRTKNTPQAGASVHYILHHFNQWGLRAPPRPLNFPRPPPIFLLPIVASDLLIGPFDDWQ